MNGRAYALWTSAFALELLAALSPCAQAVELPVQVSAESLLGADKQGENWTVAPMVQSDGMAWTFTVQTPYGELKVRGLRRMKDRIRELRALAVLEKMSRGQAFADAVVDAGLAPVRFGRDLVLAPGETLGRVGTGIGKIFDAVTAGVENPGGGRDPFFDSVSGITMAERELALELKVDPYSDFAPLRTRLEQVAQATAAGGVPIAVAISLIPGGAGVVASSGSAASGVSTVVYSHTSREVLELVTRTLTDLKVDPQTTEKFVENAFYSPDDAYAIADALKKLGANDSDLFIANAAAADCFDAAKRNRYRAEFLAGENIRLGQIRQFESASGFVLNRNAAGQLVAAFSFDRLTWTDVTARDLAPLRPEVAEQQQTARPLFASPDSVSPIARTELQKLGWRVETLVTSGKEATLNHPIE